MSIGSPKSPTLSNPLDGIVHWHERDEFVILCAAEKPTRYFHRCFGSERMEEEITHYFDHKKVIVITAKNPRVLNDGKWNKDILKAYLSEMIKECTCNLKDHVRDLSKIPHVYSYII